MTGEELIVISEEITSETFRKVSRKLYDAEDRGNAVRLEINSEGGSVYDALAIAGRIVASSVSVHTVGYGSTMSAATLILASGHKRSMSRFAWFMVHEAQDTMKGTVTAMQHHVTQARKEETQWAVIMEELTDTPRDTWIQLAAECAYLTPQQCFQLGVVDAII